MGSPWIDSNEVPSEVCNLLRKWPWSAGTLFLEAGNPQRPHVRESVSNYFGLWDFAVMILFLFAIPSLVLYGGDALVAFTGAPVQSPVPRGWIVTPEPAAGALTAIILLGFGTCRYRRKISTC